MPISTPDALWSSPVARRLRRSRWRSMECAAGSAMIRSSTAWTSRSAGARVLVAGVNPEAASLLLRIMAGLARPEHGLVTVAGLVPRHRSPRAGRVGSSYVGSEPGIPPWMTPSESLELAARLAGIDGPQRERLIDESLLRFQLGAIRDRPLRHAGRIVAERTALAAALLPDPEFSSSTNRSVHAPPDRLRFLRIPGERRTVLIASRYPAQEAGLVERVVLIRDGRIALRPSRGARGAAASAVHPGMTAPTWQWWVSPAIPEAADLPTDGSSPSDAAS